MQNGSLTVVGTGIQLSHISLEAKGIIGSAEKLLYLVADPITASWLCQENSTAESLHVYYANDKERLITYKEMVERILFFVRQDNKVCAAFYGHPGVFAHPSHESIRKAKQEGFYARMLPAISAEDCLFADLGVDPGISGCQSFEATDFLVYKRRFDVRSSLILWQIGVIAEPGCRAEPNADGLRVLVEYLSDYYGANHNVAIYQSSQISICESLVNWVELGYLDPADVSPLSTLYVPPCETPIPDKSMLERLSILKSPP